MYYKGRNILQNKLRELSRNVSASWPTNKQVDPQLLSQISENNPAVTNRFQSIILVILREISLEHTSPVSFAGFVLRYTSWKSGDLVIKNENSQLHLFFPAPKS